LRNKLRRCGWCEHLALNLPAAGIVAARFIARIDGCTVPIRALRNKLRRYGWCKYQKRNAVVM